MIRLTAWLRLPTGDVRLAGEIRVADPDPRNGGQLRGEFRYASDYLEHAHAFALDPVHLPLTAGVTRADRPWAGAHGIFEDSLPDAWGRGILIRRLGLPRVQHTPPHLLAVVGTDCLGALAYTATPSTPEPPAPMSAADLARLVVAAERYEANPADLADDELADLFRAASSPGGARPKVLIEHAGIQWLVKLRSARDEIDMVTTEAACLALARMAGLEVVDWRLEPVGRRPVLMVRRFDVSTAGRYHLASMQTLLGADGWYSLGYADLADVLRRVSAAPETDIPDLYRQMVFNAFLGNTDDHLKNFAMRRDENGWRLTPAFDLTPDVPARIEHVLHFGTAGQSPTREALHELARAFGLSARRSRSIIEAVATAFCDWRGVFEQIGVTETDLARMGPDIERRRQALAA